MIVKMSKYAFMVCAMHLGRMNEIDAVLRSIVERLGV